MRRSPDSPAFLIFGLVLGAGGLILLLTAGGPARGAGLQEIGLLAAIALTMRLSPFTIPPRIVVSLVYTVQLAAVVLAGGVVAAWISIGTFLLATLVRRPTGVTRGVFLAVVAFNVGMEALMNLAAGGVFSWLWGGAAPVRGGLDEYLLTPAGLFALLAVAATLKAVNEVLMIAGSYLRGVAVGDYLHGMRRVLPVEAAMLPLGLLIVLVGETTGAKGLAVAALVLLLASLLVKRLSDTRDALHRINVDLERRVGELDVLGRVSRAISSTIESDTVLEAIHRHCSELVDTGNFFIALLDREAGELEIALHTEAGQRLPKQKIRLGEGLTSLVIQRREPLLLRDIDREAADLPIKPVQATPLPTRSWLGVPLIAGDEVVGVMTIQDEKENAYDENTVRVLRTIAAQAAITIKNARLVGSIVDQARLEQELRDLRLVNQRKNEFVNMVAHQLQAPLTAIMGFSELVRRQPAAGESAEHLGLIQRESRRLSDLVEQLLSLSRIRSGRIAPVRRRVDLNAIAREAVDALAVLIRDRRIALEVGLDPAGLPVDADPALLHEAVANLLNNAVKYSPAGSRVEIRTGRGPGPPGAGEAAGGPADGELALLTVRDGGPGVAPEDRDRIFEEFYRSPSPEAQQVKGSGLGLTIAREIIEIHGGAIGVEPAPGGGSVFWFRIPAAEGGRGAPAGPDAAARAAG